MSKTILITGASSGIGQAAALALASTDNCLILVSMKNKEGLENTAKKAKEKGADVLTFSVIFHPHFHNLFLYFLNNL